MKPSPRLFRFARVVAAVGGLAASLVSAKPPAGYPPLRDYAPAALGDREPELQLPYPGPARAHGVVRGTARVSVLVGADGKPADYLVTAYTHRAFGDALLADLKAREFRSAKIAKTPVPGRVEIGYQFEQSQASLSPMEEAAVQSKLGADTLEYAPMPESKLDAPLTITAASLPMLPPDANLAPGSGSPVRVFVTFFVDEDGRVRIPQVESTPSPALVAHAVRAVQTWKFNPPTSKGKPVLVLTGRSVRFLTEADAARQASQR